MRNVVEISTVENEERLGYLRHRWNQILVQSRSDTIFLTWEWLMTWWRSYGAGKVLWILEIKRDGKLVGLAPLYRKRISWLGIQYNALYLIGDGSGDSDYLDIIAINGEEDLVVNSITSFLLNHSDQWDIFFVNEVPQTSPNLDLLRKYFRRAACYWKEEESPCTYIVLPSGWDDYVRRLKPRMRTKVRSLTTQIENSFDVRFDRCGALNELDARLESLFDLHGQRWSHKGQEGVFVSPDRCEFYRAMARLFHSRGWLRFYSLALDNRYVAHQFCFEYHNQMFLLQEGFDPSWNAQGIGNVLRAYVLRDCIERRVSVYDFLAGVTFHKLAWGAQVKSGIRGAIGRPTAKTRLFFEVPQVIALGKKSLKRVLPERLLTAARSLRSGRTAGVQVGRSRAHNTSHERPA
jgi:CelD/BcsL family acetyltransferase involved in cellulose biosynthesis